jgi:hypothetical protein
MRLFGGDLSSKFDGTLFALSGKASFYRVMSLARVVEQVRGALQQRGCAGDAVAAVHQYLGGSCM